MKGFLRSVAAMLLIVLFASFCLWRYEKLSFIGDTTSYLRGAFDRFNRFKELFAPDEGEAPGEEPGGPVDSSGDYGDYKPSEGIDASLDSVLRQGITNLDTEIDLSALSPTRDAVKNAMSAIIYSSPEYFYLKSNYNLTVSGDTVLALSLTYSTTKEDVVKMRTAYREKLAEIVAGAPRDGSDFDKILYLHDYFIQNYTYDETLTVRDAYTFFVGKTGVCQAYMLGLIAAAGELGIESLPVTSDTMKHAWNLVKIDGAWYHVDLTWDDSSSHPTLTSYTYFLQSDAGLTAIDAGKKEADRHRAWVAAEAATDTKYDGAVFRNTVTPIVKHEGVYYLSACTQNSAANVRGEILSGADITAMTHFAYVKGGYWVAGENSYYTDCYAGILVESGYLYYNSGNSVSRVSLTAPATDYRVYLVTDLGVGESIYGITCIENGNITYLKAAAPHASEYTLGACRVVQ